MNDITMELDAENKQVEEPTMVENSDTASLVEQSVENIDGSKFKNTAKLLEAYKNLEAEFTRKSIKLKELEKLSSTKDERVVPIYEQDDWVKRVDNFINCNPLAKSFKKEIGLELSRDKTLACNKDCLEIALARTLAITDNIDRLRTKVIRDNGEKLPHLINGVGNTMLTPPKKPRNLKDCGALVEKMFMN